MRLHGESVTAIAAQAGLSLSRVRDFLRLAADAEPVAQVQVNAAGVTGLAMPSTDALGAAGHAPGDAIAGAQ